MRTTRARGAFNVPGEMKIVVFSLLSQSSFFSLGREMERDERARRAFVDLTKFDFSLFFCLLLYFSLVVSCSAQNSATHSENRVSIR